jgi:glucokinase
MILAADIGGTKCKLALLEPGAGLTARPRLVTQERLPSTGFADAQSLVRDFLARHPAQVTAAAFAVAGPVVNYQVRATNLPWGVNGAELARTLHLPRVTLLNDLEATGYGLALLAPAELIPINEGTANPAANQALIAAGTGLGEAILFRRDGRTVVSPGEGGHTDFAPRTEEEIELLRYLKHKHRRVSWEHVLGGPGFRRIHEFLDATARHPSFDDPEADPAPEITEYALAGKCTVCVRTHDLWARLYGAEAGNLAMKALALGGVFVAGGIATKLRNKLREGSFFEAFCDKSRFGELLRRIPIHIVLNEDAPVLGAAAVAAEGSGE